MLKTIAGRDGRDGVDGVDGKSVYDMALDFGFLGTKRDFFALVLGKTWAMDHESVYQAAISHGFTGSLDQLLELLRGPPGADGKSAYEIAVEHGFDGTKADWLQSLKGKDGRDGKDGEKGERGIRGEKGEKGDRGERGPAGSGGVVSGGGSSIYAKGIKLQDAGGFYPDAGNVEAALQQIAGGGGGGGAVDSVNGQTGVVVLTAADVGAASAADLANYLPLTLGTDTTVDLGTYNLRFATNNTAMNAVIQGSVSIADWETFAPTGIQGFVALGTNGNGGGSSFVGVDFSNVATGPGLFLNKTRGTAAVPLAVQSGDSLGTVFWGGYDGAFLQNPNYIESVVVGPVSAGVVPTDLVFYAGGSVGGFVEAGRIKDNGDLQWVGSITSGGTAVALLTATITNGDTTHAPSGDAVFDALANKADLVGGVIPTAQIPAIAITEYLGTVASQAAMLALVGQKGDWALRSDLGTTFVITGNDPTQLSDWVQLNYPTAPVTSVNGQTGTVTITTVSGNAGTATTLQTSRNIDGQAFNGSADITVIAPGTHAATSKATPVDADELPLVDSAASNVLKKLTWANAKATLKAYFDTLYGALASANTWAAQQTFAACTTSIASFVMNAGTLMSTAAVGAWEFAGGVFYSSTSASSRGVVPSVQWASNESVVSLSNSSAAAQSIFPAANDFITLQGSMKYRFNLWVRLTTGNTTHTTALGFGGTATYTRVSYDAFTNPGNAGAINTNPSMVWVTTNNATVLNATSASQGFSCRVANGEFITNAGGTCNPTVTFSAGPGGTCQIEPGTIFEIWPIGPASAESCGNFS